MSLDHEVKSPNRWRFKTFLLVTVAAVALLSAPPALAGEGDARELAEQLAEAHGDATRIAEFQAPFERVFPRSLPIALTAEGAGYQDAWVIQLRLDAQAIAVEILVVDLSTATYAARSIRAPMAFLGLDTPETAPVEAELVRTDLGDGQSRLATMASVGRMSVAYQATGPKESISSFETTASNIVAALETATPRGDVEPPREAIELSDLFSRSLSVPILAYGLVGGITALRDREWRTRFATTVRYLGRSPKRPLLAATATWVDVNKRARRRRWARSLGGLWWWLSRGFGAVGLLLLGFASVAAPGLAAVTVVLLAGFWATRRWLRLRWGRDRDRAGYTRLLRVAIPWGRRFALQAVLIVLTLVAFLGAVASGFVQALADAVVDPELSEVVSSSGELAGFAAVALLMSLVLSARLLHGRSRTEVQRVLSEDSRPAVLLLRSFADDELRLRTRRGRRHDIFERLSMRRFDRFEETLSWMLWKCGPVIGLGQPGTAAPSLGAARVYHGHDWLAAVRYYAWHSSAIALIVGSTEHLAREIDEIDLMARLPRTIFVVPPLRDSKEIDWRLRLVSQQLGLAPPPADCPGQSVTLAAVVNETGITYIGGRHRDESSYEVALDRAIEMIDVGEVEVARTDVPAPVAAPRPSLRVRARNVALSVVLPLIAIFYTVGMVANGIFEVRIAALDHQREISDYYLPTLASADAAEDWPVPGGLIETTNEFVATWDLDGDLQILDWDMDDVQESSRTDVGFRPTTGTSTGSRLVLGSLLDRTVVEVDTRTGEILDRVDGLQPIAMAIVGERVAVSDLTDGVILLDRGRVSPLASISPDVLIAEGSFMLGIDTGADKVWRLDPTTRDTTEINVCSQPRAATIVGGRAIVACHGGEIVEISASGDTRLIMALAGVVPRLVVANDEFIAIIDARTYELVVLSTTGQQIELPVGIASTDLAVVDRRVFMTTPDEDRVGIYDLNEVANLDLGG